jgi:hypothetical protein
MENRPLLAHPVIRRLLLAAGLLAAAAAQAEDSRRLVEFPPMMLEHEMRNMRDHLATLQKIQDAGLSSFGLHGAHDVAPFMPAGMQAIGTEMHKAASRFALEVNKAAATGDLRPSIAALGKVTEQCVACHAAYRLH